MSIISVNVRTLIGHWIGFIWNNSYMQALRNTCNYNKNPRHDISMPPYCIRWSHVLSTPNTLIPNWKRTQVELSGMQLLRSKGIHTNKKPCPILYSSTRLHKPYIWYENQKKNSWRHFFLKEEAKESKNLKNTGKEMGMGITNSIEDNGTNAKHGNPSFLSKRCFAKGLVQGIGCFDDDQMAIFPMNKKELKLTEALTPFLTWVQCGGDNFEKVGCLT